jgi:hypothetical protein
MKCKDGANRKLQGIKQLERAGILKFQEFLSDKEKHLQASTERNPKADGWFSVAELDGSYQKL